MRVFVNQMIPDMMNDMGMTQDKKVLSLKFIKKTERKLIKITKEREEENQVVTEEVIVTTVGKFFNVYSNINADSINNYELIKIIEEFKINVHKIYIKLLFKQTSDTAPEMKKIQVWRNSDPERDMIKINKRLILERRKI